MSIDLRKARVLILGGTGTLGRALTRTLVTEFPSISITILSRDEHKQASMKREFPQCRYVLGDIRDYDQIARHFYNKDVVFHVAALKHVDILENNVNECIKTNVLGTQNAADAAINANVKYFVFSSTDKAVDPINTYGYCKALSEKILFSHNKSSYNPTRFSVYRWGNVVGSQGSVIPIFAKSIKETKTANITDFEMTRFWLPIDWAVRFMLRTFYEAKLDQAMICPNMKSASVLNVIMAIGKILGVDQVHVATVGLRPGEKIHEVMTSQHSPEFMSSDTADVYTESELIELLQPIVQQAVS